MVRGRSARRSRRMSGNEDEEEETTVLEISFTGASGRKNAHYVRGPHKSVTPPTVFLEDPCQSFLPLFQ